MSDENNSISATTVAIKNGLRGATINTSSSLTSSSSSSLNSSSGSGTTIVAAVTDSSNHHHHNTVNNNGAASTTTTTSTISGRHISGIVRIKTEPVENNDSKTDYTTCKRLVGGASGTEVVGRIQTSSSSGVAAGATSGGSVQGTGGRLQFFKDGKFILELARAKEGEKSGWVSVPRKQFRSPSESSSTVTLTYPKNRSSTSLISDDNSSIQRNHCYKQLTPRRGISKEMCFHFKRTKHILFSLNGLKTARIKRRRPLDSSVCPTPPFGLIKNGCNIIVAEIEIKSEVLDSDDYETAAMDDEKSFDDSSTEKEESSKTPNPELQSDTIGGMPISVIIKTEDNQPIIEAPTAKTMNGEKRLKPQAKLTTIVQKLIDRLPTGLFHLSKTQIIGGATQQQHAHSHSHHQTHLSHHICSTSSRLASESHYYQQHVSPRKPPSSSNYVTNGNRTETISSNTSNMTPNSTPTRPNSIASLLEGNSNSSSNLNSTRIKVEHGYNDPSYLAMLASTKSPEGSTNSKALPYSSSTSGSAKKRSPPYSPVSEIHHQHHARNRSPNVDASYGNMRSPPEAHSSSSYGNNSGGGPAGNSSRLTPPSGYLASPKNSNPMDGYKAKPENLTNSSPNHHFYSPYMLSPIYVSPPSSISPNNLLASDNYHPKIKGAKSPSQQNFRASVFHTQSPHASTSHRVSSPIATQSSPTSGDGSGGLGMTTSSTPRIVPKKTVSTRRQFASPSSSSSSPGEI